MTYRHHTLLDPYNSPRFGGSVDRYSSWPTSASQTNADHTWNVIRIYIQIFGELNHEELVAIMYHDVGEVQSGDIPFPTKMLNPALKVAHDTVDDMAYVAITDGEKYSEIFFNWKSKICDLMEMCEFGLVDLARGNMYGRRIYLRTLAATEKMLENIAMTSKLNSEQKTNLRVYINGVKDDYQRVELGLSAKNC